MAQAEQIVPLIPFPVAHWVQAPVMLLQAKQVVHWAQATLLLLTLLKVLAGQTSHVAPASWNAIGQVVQLPLLEEQVLQTESQAAQATEPLLKKLVWQAVQVELVISKPPRQRVQKPLVALQS